MIDADGLLRQAEQLAGTGSARPTYADLRRASALHTERSVMTWPDTPRKHSVASPQGSRTVGFGTTASVGEAASGHLAIGSTPVVGFRIELERDGIAL